VTARPCYCLHTRPRDTHLTTTATIRVRLSAEITEKLSKLANDTGRTKASLAAEAVAAYVDRELEIVKGIKFGLDDARAGRLVPHEQVTAEAREIIAKTKRG
jgi:predicted transcriptional regulator